MGFYDNLQNTASKLLQKYGQQISFLRTTPGVYDPSTGEPASSTDTLFTGYGAVMEYSAMEKTGDSIQDGDIKIILEKSTVTPEVGDIVTANGKSFVAVHIKHTNPAGTIVMTEIQARLGEGGVIQR